MSNIQRYLTPLISIVLLIGCVYLVVNQSAQLALLPGANLGNSEVVYLKSESEFPRQIIDPIGRVVELPEPPSVIVSGILAGDEMLTKLVDQSRVRSVTYLSDNPGISNVAGYYSDSIHRNHGAVEEILAAEPDLVIVAAYSNATSVEMLLNTGVPIIRFADFHSYSDVRKNVTTLAKALGEEKHAENWLRDMDQRIENVKSRVADQPKPRVLYYSLSGSTSGPGSLMDETINIAGGKNVIAETGLQAYSRISPEMAISLQPDVILVSDWAPEGGKSAQQILMEDLAWQDVPAIKNNRLYSLRGAWLTSGSPYRVKGVELVAKLLHPTVFSAEGTGRHEL